MDGGEPQSSAQFAVPQKTDAPPGLAVRVCNLPSTLRVTSHLRVMVSGISAVKYGKNFVKAEVWNSGVSPGRHVGYNPRRSQLWS